MTYNVNKQGQTNLYQPNYVSKEEYVKTLEDCVFYSLEVQLQNGIPLQPVHTNFIPADPDKLGELAENFFTSQIINDSNINENGTTPQNSAGEETQL